MFDLFSSPIFIPLRITLEILAPFFALWWLILPVGLGFLVWEQFKTYTRAKFFAGLKWTVLEIRVPHDLHRGPKAVEQIFIGLHGIQAGGIKWRDRIFKGKVPEWFSFEIVSTHGLIHFYVRTLEQYRNLVEAQIYAQFPEAEISEAADYVDGLPSFLPNDTYDLWGAELKLTKEDGYPIRTYEEYEEKSAGKDDIKRIDPLASLSEVLSNLGTDEHLWIQLLIRPAGDEWVKRAKVTMDTLLGKTPKAPPTFFDRTMDLIAGLLTGPAAPAAPKEEKKPEMAPGAGEAVRAIERSISKLGHESGIRFVYIAKKEVFKRPHIAGINGAFKQFSSQTLNGFTNDKASMPGGKWPLKAQQEFKKKVRIVNRFRKRLFIEKPYVLTTEELATVFHFPDIGVKTLALPRIEAKKGEPPAGLPVT